MGQRQHYCGRGLIRLTMFSAAGLLGVLATTEAQAAKTYYIEESTDYTGNGCQNADLNDVTWHLHESMSAAGWTGERWMNANAWPQDFMESCSTTYGSDGSDNLYADTKSVAVYAGHGNVGLLAYGYKHSNRCTVDFSSNMRLGSMGGDIAAVAIWLVCDALQVASLPAEANYQWTRQQLGWTNTIAIDNWEPSVFFDLTGTHLEGIGVFPPVPLVLVPGATNADAWLAVMGDDGRHPIAVSYGSSSSGCWTIHDNAKLKDDTYTSARPGSPTCGQGQPAFWYCYETI